ncbi:MAG: efflux RND transporter periplasmic adaptor subunit [Vicinamibacteria bacterium]|jgi:membrane fusion protein (multidrug efflux system)|nr:efflux RND transporter periplasmic adaptor subunit [Vicinamibacteria bacterium]
MKTGSIALIALTGLFACHSNRDTKELTRALPVRTAVAAQRDIQRTLSFTGTLRPHAQVQIVTEVSARLMSILKDEGAMVASGETLAVLDETDYRLAYERAQAAMAVAEANRAHAMVEKERADNLLKTGGITDKDHLAAQVGLQVAEAALGQVRAETAIAGQQLARCRVKAPFAGRVARRMPDPGALLGVGTPIFTLVDDSTLEFHGTLPSADYGTARVGALADIEIDALPGQTFQGRVARITPLIDERTRAFDVVITLPGRKTLAGGLFARVRLQIEMLRNVLILPPNALVRDGARPDRADVFVVVAGKAERKAVVLGVEQPDGVQVKSGLAAGDNVILDPPAALGSGMAVEAQNGDKRPNAAREQKR